MSAIEASTPSPFGIIHAWRFKAFGCGPHRSCALEKGRSHTKLVDARRRPDDSPVGLQQWSLVSSSHAKVRGVSAASKTSQRARFARAYLELTCDR